MLDAARASEVNLRLTVKAELDAHMKQAEERNKALREKEKLLSDNDSRIKDLEKSRRYGSGLCPLLSSVVSSSVCRVVLCRLPVLAMGKYFVSVWWVDVLLCPGSCNSSWQRPRRRWKRR